MFISNQNRKLMDLKLKDNVPLFASETKPECSKVDIVTDHGLDVNCMNVDDFVKSQFVADIHDAVKLYVTKDMNPVGDISNKISVIESYRIENKSKHEMADYHMFRITEPDLPGLFQAADKKKARSSFMVSEWDLLLNEAQSCPLKESNGEHVFHPSEFNPV
ncbi:hypothetical protein Tco_1211281 [Tanacetum coccineum]